MISDNHLYGRANDPNKKKELKVRIPAGMHMRLHGLKIMSDKSISAAVTEALDSYFERHAVDDRKDSLVPPGSH